eukprot:CAMPEP_0195530980 /NCGR_PEP_ID=MMETSP0794_2-20130614/34100_1 /TAXON_ID=515487 /ORGANISM="Stephanopyxis turris, Strain CCMP 815" /LENGTH=831 /DNA_ID=CAMNT_0040662609 /DNA_START=54 /DNA_END=2549 /DNA_ORIENTATION=-
MLFQSAAKFLSRVKYAGGVRHYTRSTRRNKLDERAVLTSASSDRTKEEVRKPKDSHAPGKHYEVPDDALSEYEISYSLAPIHVKEFPAKLSNFQVAKDFYERSVLDGNKEQEEVYVDSNAFQLFDTVFPEIVKSRRIGKLEKDHFQTWDYRNEPERVLIEKAFKIIDRDENGFIDTEEIAAIMKRAGLGMDDGVFDAIDTDNSGEIDMDEFRKFWESSKNANGPEAIRRFGGALQDYLEEISKPLVENNVEVLLQPKDLKADKHVDLLTVGGPSSYSAALIHKAQYPEKSILHVVGHRFDSNADGSAYYYHERDAFPLYVNKVNTGWYCVYADLNKRFRSFESLRDLCVKDRHHVKIALNWWSLIKNPWMVMHIFIPNTWHAFQDLVVKQPKDSLMAQACLHSQRVPKIVSSVCDSLGLPNRAFLIRDPDRAVYIDVEGQKRAGEHFDWLNSYADIPYHSLDPSVFGSLVTEALAFNRDGALNPWMFENFHHAFKKVGIETKKEWFLDSIYVQPDPAEPHRLVGTSARFKCIASGDVKVVSFDKIIFSLGPSGTVSMDPNMSETPPQASGVRGLMNTVQRTIARGTMAYKGTMWAAGSSSVCLLGIKRGAADGQKLDTFRKFIDGVNQHWTLVKEREVTTGAGDTFDFFVLQMTGGGNFPSRHTKPDFVLNLLYTTEAIFGLEDFEEGDIVYDIIQSRGCGRSVSSRNTVGFSPIAKNAVAAYGLGGIGMTTAFANGALQLQIIEALKEEKGEVHLNKGASTGQIGSDASQTSHNALFGENIFEGVNYKAMIDDPQKVARALGVDSSISATEKKWIGASIASALAGFAAIL